MAFATHWKVIHVQSTHIFLYSLFLDRGGRRINWLEQYLGHEEIKTFSINDLENEATVYEALFSGACRSKMERLYLDLLDEMNGMPYGQCESLLETLIFIQEVSATALWKYRQNVGEIIEKFVRDFDRLDVPSERVRLYEQVQKD